jgi:hypothetical protein
MSYSVRLWIEGMEEGEMPADPPEEDDLRLHNPVLLAPLLMRRPLIGANRTRPEKQTIPVKRARSKCWSKNGEGLCAEPVALGISLDL